MATQFMASVPQKELRKCIGSLAEQQNKISEALDMLFIGF